MLQDIRSNIQGTVAKIIIGLIVISFSIFGIESLLFSGGGSAIAEVNGEEISPLLVQQEVSLLQRQLASMLGENADPSMLDQSMLNEQAVQSLVQRTLLTQAARELELSASDRIIGTIIGSMEEFQVDGQFSPDMFRSRLSAAGYTPGFFRTRLSEDILQTQLRAGIAGSGFVTDADLRAAARVRAEGRDVRYITLPLSRFRDSVAVDAAEIEAFYDANGARFTSEESLDIDYLELRLEDYLEPVDEERIREEFEIVRGEFEQAEETRVSHILFEGDPQARQERLLAAQQAISGGMSFEEAAEELSDDIGSSSSGGDLGYTDGTAFPDPMEEAIATLAVGEIGSVETDAGTHLLLITDRRAGSAVEFADVRAELEQRIQERDASAALLRDVERLRDLVFNAADLGMPAEELGLTVQHAAGVTRATAEGLLSNPRLQQAAFSEDVMDAGHNSEVIELSARQFAVLRVAERTPPQLRPLAEVRDVIEGELKAEKARQSAGDAARALLRQLQGGASIETVANEAGYDWQVELAARRDSARLVPELRNRVFSLHPPGEDGKPVRDIIETSDSVLLLELVRVTPGTLEALSEAERVALKRSLTSEMGRLQIQQYEASLRASADIVVY